MLSILFVIVGLHLLRTMQYIPFGVGPRVMAITKTMRDRDILPFYLVLIVMILIFSGGLQFAFGNEIIEYRYLSSSFETIFLAMFGDFSLPRHQMTDANIGLAYGLFVAVSILLTLYHVILMFHRTNMHNIPHWITCRRQRTNARP